jgi:hypothetical protein
VTTEPPGDRVDRRALLRKAVAAGAVGWTVPVIISSGPAAAGVFTSKCAPSAITALAGFTQLNCTNNDTRVQITISFSGSCPCGGTPQWCARKNSPGGAGSFLGTVLQFAVTIPIRRTINIAGKVALGCTDGDGDTQFAVYDWTMTATDNGSACSTANSISGVSVTGRTLVNSATCPPLTASLLAPLELTVSPTREGPRPTE